MDEFLLRENESIDDLILGNMKIIQPQKGYRFTIDSVLIAFFADLRGVQQAVDLGTGSGVIPLLLSFRDQHIKISGVELLGSVCERAQRSILFNGLCPRIKIIQGDIKNIAGCLPAGKFDLVVSNPPFWKKGEGRVSKNHEEALAKHELKIDLPQIIAAASYLLRPPRGKLCLIHRAERLEEIFRYLDQYQLNSTRIRLVQAFPDRQANLVLIEAQKTEIKQFLELEPLVIYEKRGIYSEEIRRIYTRTC